MVQGDGPISTGRDHSRIHRRTLIVEIFDELEPKQIAIETEGAPYILNVDHSVVEGKLPADTQIDGYLSSCRLALLDSRPLRGTLAVPVRGDFLCHWLLHGSSQLIKFLFCNAF